jgi:predicted transcriptional regulator
MIAQEKSAARFDLIVKPGALPVPADEKLLELTSGIVVAYLTRNTASLPEVPGMIRHIHSTLASLVNGTTDKPMPSATPTYGVTPLNSVTPDYIVCLEDGKRLRTLKRYLKRFDLTPDQYRAKWNLPQDYPMVAPNYAAKRSELAKEAGLGKRAPRPRRRKR